VIIAGADAVTEAKRPDRGVRPARQKSFRKFLLIIVVIVVLSFLALQLRALLPGRPTPLIIQVRNHMETEVTVSITVDGSPLDPLLMEPEERITFTVSEFLKDARHTVVVSTPDHETRTAETRLGLNINFQLFRDATITYSFF